MGLAQARPNQAPALCGKKRQRSTWQRYRDDLELHSSEHNQPIARGH